MGGWIDIILHQLYIVKEVSERYAPHGLLSGAVNLGKPIDPCFILHRLLVNGRV